MIGIAILAIELSHLLHKVAGAVFLLEHWQLVIGHWTFILYFFLLPLSLHLWYIPFVNIEEIQNALVARTFRYTKHGAEQRINRGISSDEIEQAVLAGEIIEDYPFDKYGPSCLILGKTERGRTLHIQIALYPIISIVTVYEPIPEKWIKAIIRR